MKKKKMICIAIIAIALAAVVSYTVCVYVQSQSIANQDNIISEISENTGAQSDKITIKQAEAYDGYYFIFYTDESYNSYKYCTYTMKKTILPGRYKTSTFTSGNTPFCETTEQTNRKSDILYAYMGENNNQIQQINIIRDEKVVKEEKVDNGTYMIFYLSEDDNSYEVTPEYIFIEE